jgi:Glycosyltransferase Family 4
MRIAQVAPLIERVPPRLYGGTERVVAYLTDELVRQGHDVTLFASGDSRTLARLVPCSREGFCQVSRHRPGRRRLASPEDCGGAGHLGSRSSNHWLQFSTAILTGASADRTPGQWSPDAARRPRAA